MNTHTTDDMTAIAAVTYDTAPAFAPPIPTTAAVSHATGATKRASLEWWREAVFYELHVRAFADSNGDGSGDFEGLHGKLDYLHDLGVTVLWLLPFYPSPYRDGGYDIADYRRVDPTFGDLRILRRLLRGVHERGMRVVTELVLNHTSDQHPWFQRARTAPAGSRWRNFYVWSDTADRYRGARIIFKDFETSNWTWDDAAQAYFWHRFYRHQPDLNYDNPEVQEEMLSVLDYWFDMGVDGVRLDAVPYLYEREGTSCENLPETHAFLKKLRAHVDAKYHDRLLLAEANQWPDDAAAYFGDGDECHMNYHFPLMPRLFMSLRQENRAPIVDILDQTPQLPKGCAWGTFLRNHDELTLEMVTDEERDYMWRAYAADPVMRLNQGIRRRLAPLLGNDRRKIELLNGLLFSLPGTPVLYYGDEIGMGDNIYLGDRDGVRTPMQWSPDRNAGFSRAPSQRLFLPPIVDGPYHYETVNVETQRQDPSSLWSWMRQLIAVRQLHPVLATGDVTFLEPDNQSVLAYVRTLEGTDPLLVVANLAVRPQAVQLDLRKYLNATPVEVFGQSKFPRVGEWPYQITLAPFGFYWFALVPEREAADADTWAPPRLEGSWPGVLAGRSPEIAAPLARWIRQRRWFAGKSRAISSVRLLEVAPLPGASTRSLLRLCFVAVEYAEGEPDTYVVPLTVLEGERARVVCTFRPGAVVAHLPDGRPIADGLHDEGSAWELAQSLGTRRRSGALQADPYPELRAVLSGADEHSIRLLPVEQSNTSIVVDDKVILKVVRRLHGGVSPDLEVGRHLRSIGFEDQVPLVGSLAWNRDGAAEPDTVALAFGFLPNEGDAWTHVLHQLDLFLDDTLADADRRPPALSRELFHPGEPATELGVAAGEMALMGRRTAEVHLALASGEGEAFSAEPFTSHYQRSLYQALRSQIRMTLTSLRQNLGSLEPALALRAETVIAGQERLLGRIQSVIGKPIHASRIRVHGDFHLGQVLFTGRDFVIIDFEGEPARPIGERRIKQSPLRDVAGMLRSFDYATQMALSTRAERGLLQPDTTQYAMAGAWMRWWRDAAGAAFLSGYLATAGIDRLLPRDPANAADLLEVLVLEKMMYELRYELDNRPSWAYLPLAALAEAVQA